MNTNIDTIPGMVVRAALAATIVGLACLQGCALIPGGSRGSASTPAGTVTASAPGRGDMVVATGTYHCELDRSVHVRHVSADGRSMVLSWDRKDYTVKAVSSASGALRYEDRSSGLVWLTIPAKSMLLDTREGRQLANECHV